MLEEINLDKINEQLTSMIAKLIGIYDSLHDYAKTDVVFLPFKSFSTSLVSIREELL